MTAFLVPVVGLSFDDLGGKSIAVYLVAQHFADQELCKIDRFLVKACWRNVHGVIKSNSGYNAQLSNESIYSKTN